MENIILHSTPLQDFRDLIGSVIDEKLRHFKPEPQPSTVNSEYGTREQVRKRLNISLATLHYRTQDGTLKKYRIGGRVLYKWSEVEQAITEIQTGKYKHRGK